MNKKHIIGWILVAPFVITVIMTFAFICVEIGWLILAWIGGLISTIIGALLLLDI